MFINSQISKIAQNIRLQEWGRMIQECKSRPTGMTIGEWRAQHNITKCDYYYRMRAVRKACILLWNRGLTTFSFAGIIYVTVIVIIVFVCSFISSPVIRRIPFVGKYIA